MDVFCEIKRLVGKMTKNGGDMKVESKKVKVYVI